MDIKFKSKKEVETKKDSKSESEVAEFVSYLQACSIVVKRMHWKTTSYSTHKTLDKLFEGLLDNTDSIAEKASGYLGIHLSDFEDYPCTKYTSMEPSTYLKEVKTYIQSNRYIIFPKDYSPIQNEIDNLTNLIDNSLYLLTLK